MEDNRLWQLNCTEGVKRHVKFKIPTVSKKAFSYKTTMYFHRFIQSFLKV